MPIPLYPIDAKGERWRVHDRAVGPSHELPRRWRRIRLESELSSYRAFVIADGEEWRCMVGADDDLSTEPDLLQAQRHATGYVAREPLDASEEATVRGNTQ